MSDFSAGAQLPLVEHNKNDILLIILLIFGGRGE